jgi:phosphomevalonate kinase
MITIKAPGKLVIGGEYGVLLGLRAVVAAINKYAHGTFSPGESLQFRYQTTENIVHNNDHQLFMAAVATAKSLDLPVMVGEYFIDTRDFFFNGRKLGLGSSAAAATALAALIMRADGKVVNPDQIFKLASAIHRHHAQNTGSGIDVAASSFGGLFAYSTNAAEPLIEPLPVPPWWEDLLVIDSQQSQSTSEFVTRFWAARSSMTHKIDDLLKTNELLTQELARAPDLGAAIAVVQEINGCLKKLGDLCQIDIVSPVHEAIFSIAERFGGSCKPSGAGGGDIALALMPADARDPFLAACQEQGFANIAGLTRY